ncbi:MAG: acyltransferase [Erythrobacter sp.]
MSSHPIASAGVAHSRDQERPSDTGGPRPKFNTGAHGLRGIAALMVMLAHIFGGTAEHIYSDSGSYVSLVERPWLLGIHGVELFFVISGYVIWPSAQRYSFKQFFLRRFFRLYPLFAALSLLFVILNLATNAYPHTNNWQSVVSGFLFLNLFTGTEQLTPNAWSLTYEVIFYLLAATVVAARREGGTVAMEFLAYGLCLAFLFAFPIAFYFVAGILIRSLHGKVTHERGTIRILEIVALIGMVISATQRHYEYDWADFTEAPLLLTILFTALYFYAAIDERSFTARFLSAKWALYLGTISYSLYLVHPYTYFTARLAFERLGLFTPNIPASMALFTIVVSAGSLLASHFVHITLEVWPYKRFFRQPIYREKTAQDEPGIAK